VANRLVQDLGQDRARFEITALRPPTFEQLQKELSQAKAAGRPFHIVHFDGHGIYADLSQTSLADWLQALSVLTLGGQPSGKHGYLLFEHPGDDKMRPVLGSELGQLLHDTGVPVLALNACQSAMHDAGPDPDPAAAGDHDKVRAIGSLTQAVIDQGIPAVLGMRYSVFVVTAAQYIGELYAGLAQGRSFGQAASAGRKHLARNPERWVGLLPRPLQDWFVPVVYEAAPIQLLPPDAPAADGERPELDPVQNDPALLRYVPDTGFVGRDETLLLLDRAFDAQPVVLLHAYAGQGKTATSIEFARWYAETGGLGPRPAVLFTSFEHPTDLNDVLNQIGQPAIADWSSINEMDQKRRQIIQLLRNVPVLWIWDNVEPVAGFPEGSESLWTGAEQRDLADFLKQIKLDRASQAKILLTSRRDEQAWLGGLPYRIKMSRMSHSDAANLARSLGSDQQIARQAIAAWQPLLDYCQGNPLTLRVIAGQAIRMGLHGQEPIEAFVEAIRSGEQAIEDADEKQGRDKSPGASLDYGFRHAFQPDEQPLIALLHLFQGTVDVDALEAMGKGDHALPELKGQTKAGLTSLLDRARETGLLTHLGGAWYSIHPALPWFLRQLFARHYDGEQGRSSATAALRPGSKPSACWATTTTGNSTQATGTSSKPSPWKKPTCCTPAAPPAAMAGGFLSSPPCRACESSTTTRAACPNGPGWWPKSRMITAPRPTIPSPAGKTTTAWSWTTGCAWPDTTTGTCPGPPPCRKSWSPGSAGKPPPLWLSPSMPTSTPTNTTASARLASTSPFSAIPWWSKAAPTAWRRTRNPSGTSSASKTPPPKPFRTSTSATPT
jgi:hypothetical protein